MRNEDNEEQRRIFAKNLRDMIYSSGKTQKEVATETGFSPTTLNNWVRQRSMPKLGEIQKLADYFGVGKTELISDKLDDNPEKDVALLYHKDIMDLAYKIYNLPLDQKAAIATIVNAMTAQNENN